MTGTERDLWRSSGQTPQLKHSQLYGQTLWATMPDNISVSPRTETPEPFWATHSSAQSPSEWKMFFLQFAGKLVRFSLCVSTGSLFCHRTPLEESDCCFCSLPLDICTHLRNPPPHPSLLYSRMNRPSSLSFRYAKMASVSCLSCPSLDSLQLFHLLFSSQKSRNGPGILAVASPVLSRGEGSPPADTTGVRISLAFFTVRACSHSCSAWWPR